jgi:hypothetical protein
MEDEYRRNDLDQAHRDDAEDEKKAVEAPEADHHKIRWHFRRPTEPVRVHSRTAIQAT